MLVSVSLNEILYNLGRIIVYLSHIFCGSHTLRKTFGYIKHTVQGASLPELMVCFNHSTQRQTLDYLCIQEAAIRNVYMNEI
jgi:hypothetical protein